MTTVGITVTNNTLPGPGAIDANPGAPYFVAGQTQRGNPSNPVNVTSLAQYEALFGVSFASGFLTNDLTMFFGECPSGVAWVMRDPGNAAAATTTLDDGAETPQPTLSFTAGCSNIDPSTGSSLGNLADPGSWGDDVSVQVVASVLTGQFNVLVYYQGIQVEQWGPYATPAAATAAINLASSYVLVANLFSDSDGATANPAANDDPVALTGGTDDSGTVTAETIAAVYANFVPALGPGYVACPGYDASLVGDALEAHAAANGRLGHLSPTQGMSATTVASAAAEFRGGTGSQYVGYFWPWVTIPNPAGGSIVVPPDGFVAGRRAATIATVGVWQPPAGGYGVAQYVTGLDPASGTVTDSIGNTLNGDHVNVIRPKSGIRLYGWRSLSADTINYELLNQQDILNLLDFQINTGLQGFVFDLIDSLGQLAQAMSTEILSILQPFIDAGALYPGPATSGGQASDPGYLITVAPDPTVTNQMDVAVYVRPSPSAELIAASVTKVAVGTAF